MPSLEEIKKKIEQGLPGAKVHIQDPRKDGVHIKAVVSWQGFKGKTLVEQHKMVYATVKEDLKGDLHALGIETKQDEQ